MDFSQYLLILKGFLENSFVSAGRDFCNNEGEHIAVICLLSYKLEVGADANIARSS